MENFATIVASCLDHLVDTVVRQTNKRDMTSRLLSDLNSEVNNLRVMIKSVNLKKNTAANYSGHLRATIDNSMKIVNYHNEKIKDCSKKFEKNSKSLIKLDKELEHLSSMYSFKQNNILIIESASIADDFEKENPKCSKRQKEL